MPAVTAELAAYCANLDFATLPPEVQERTRFLVLDLVGNIVRGRHDAESTPALLAAARALGLAAGGSAVLGDSARYTPAGAAFLNGALAHASTSTTPMRPARCIRAPRSSPPRWPRARWSAPAAAPCSPPSSRATR